MLKEVILTGKWTLKTLEKLLKEASVVDGLGNKINYLSSHFIDILYKEDTLIGNINNPEIFVINLESLDCFTFLDYIEAMRLSCSFSDFKKNLQKIRYQLAEIDYQKRNHFFSDWAVNNSSYVQDVTLEVGGNKTVTVQKVLNLKEDKTFYLQGIPPRARKIRYIPNEKINDNVISRLNTGDYIGIYSNKAGLDASHVGIFINNDDLAVLRHASSKKDIRKVIDEDFRDYTKNIPGIIVLRPL